MKTLPGKPDVVFRQAEVVVFCDGDFWHGKNLEERLSKLEQGHNAPYWVDKISGNVARDRRHDAALVADGWEVLRYWESDVKRQAEAIASNVKKIVEQRLSTRPAKRRTSK